MADGFHGYGSVLKFGDGASPEAFTQVAAISRIKPPGLTTEEIDVTHLTSENAWRVKIPGMKNPENVEFEGFYMPQNATQQEMFTLHNSRAVQNWQIVLSDPDETVIAFSGFISALDFGEATLEDAVSFNGTITLSSPPEFAAVS